jgi:hypothetical protein
MDRPTTDPGADVQKTFQKSSSARLANISEAIVVQISADGCEVVHTTRTNPPTTIFPCRIERFASFDFAAPAPSSGAPREQQRRIANEQQPACPDKD